MQLALTYLWISIFYLFISIKAYLLWSVIISMPYLWLYFIYSLLLSSLVKKRKLSDLTPKVTLKDYSIKFAMLVRKLLNYILNLIAPLPASKENNSEGIQFWLICDNYCYYMWNRGSWWYKTNTYGNIQTS